MRAAPLLQRLRRESRLSLRELASLAETSHATLSAYEHGRVDPSSITLMRIASAAGFALDVRPTRRIREHGGLPRGEELEAVLTLAAAFPARQTPCLGPQRFEA